MKKVFLLTLTGILAAAFTPMSHAAQTRAEGDFSVVGYYDVSYTWGASGTDPYGSSPVIEAGENDNEVILKNFPNGGNPIVCTVDYDAKTLTIDEQFLYVNEKYDSDVYLRLWDRSTEDFIDRITAEIDEEEGTITFQPNIEIAYHMPELGKDGWIFTVYNVVLTKLKIDLFVYDPNEWIECGTASYCDHCIIGMYSYEPDDFITFSIKVPLYRHRTIRGDYLLMNPYVGTTGWDGLTIEQLFDFAISYMTGQKVWIEEPGYLRFNALDNDCVYVYPFVPTGVNASKLGLIYVYNMEGEMIVVEGKTPEEVQAKLTADNLSTSFYSQSAQTAYVYNAVMGYPSDLLANYYWYPIEYGGIGELRIKFDNDLTAWDREPDSGVDLITTNEDESVKYYNIDGREILSPAKGQLVIKKQGDKVSKLIYVNK